MKLFEIKWNCKNSLITFSISFPSMLRRTMGLKALGELYDFLLGFGIIMDVKILKCEGYNSKHASAILIILFKHIVSLIIILRCHQDNLLGPRVNKLLYLLMALINSASIKESHFIKARSIIILNSFNG